VQGIATFSVSVSIGFFSESFSMQAQYTFAGSGSGASSTSAMAYQSSEALAVLAGTDNGIPIDAGAARVPAKARKHLPRPPHKTIEPGQWQQLEPFVDETTWQSYYDTFVTS
jgi:hypothetical protein